MKYADGNKILLLNPSPPENPPLVPGKGGEKIEISVSDDTMQNIRDVLAESRQSSPLTIELVRYSKTGRCAQLTTQHTLSALKSWQQMTDRERALASRINERRDVPDSASSGDVYLPEELLGRERRVTEYDKDEIEKAKENSTMQLVTQTPIPCSKCSHHCYETVVCFATPNGEVQTRRFHGTPPSPTPVEGTHSAAAD
jgi:hypothetical protein